MSGNESQKKSRSLVQWLKLLFTPCALVAIATAGWFHRETLGEILLSAQPMPLIMSVILWVILHAISPLITRSLFQFLGESIDYRQAFQIHNKRLPAKYLPGGIWHTVARATDYHSLGMTSSVIGTYLIIENILQVLVTFAIGSLIVFSLVQAKLIESILQVLLFTSLLIMLTGPFLIAKLANTEPGKLKLRHYVHAILISTIYWSIASMAFVTFLSAFTELESDLSYVEAGGAYIFSWAVGYIAIFAPQGIGVSEFVFASILTGKTGAVEIVAFIATFRIVVLTGDLIAWILSFLTKRSAL